MAPHYARRPFVASNLWGPFLRLCPQGQPQRANRAVSFGLVSVLRLVFDTAALRPHPTLSETLMECAEAFYGHATHTFTKKKPTL